MTDEPNIAAGAGTASRSNTPNLGRIIEAAMSQAVLDCYAEGITDPVVHLQRKLLARDKAREDFLAATALAE